jgi:hypothetical protein
MTDDEAEELKLLKLSSEKGKFAINVGTRMSQAAQLALERLQEREWIKLIDVTPIASQSGIFRVFLLTKPALAFLKRQSN